MLLAISIKSESRKFSKDREPLQFLLAINTSQSRKNFQRIAIRSLIDRDQTLKKFVQRRQEDELIAIRYQLIAINIGDFEKSGL